MIDFKAIHSAGLVPELVAALGVVVVSEPQPGQWRGPCPLHQSKRPRSRSLAWTAQSWYCHKCKVGGDVLDLAQAVWQLAGPVAAAERLYSYLHQTVPLLRSPAQKLPNRERGRGTVKPGHPMKTHINFRVESGQLKDQADFKSFNAAWKVLLPYLERLCSPASETSWEMLFSHEKGSGSIAVEIQVDHNGIGKSKG